ncbi:MAG: GntR family transcriptional regulator [Vagococcus sp.]
MKEKIYNFISEEIILGNLNKNDKLTEQYIAEKLNISRTPVREALFQLTADDILEHTPRKGFKIKDLSKKDMEDIYEIIGLCDGKIASLTIDSLTNKDYATMSFLIESMDSAIKNKLYTKYNELQSQFHNVYITKCSNEKLVHEILKKKKVFIGKCHNIDPCSIQDTLYRTNREHQTILNLFIEKNTTELRSYLENTHWHIDNAQYDIW